MLLSALAMLIRLAFFAFAAYLVFASFPREFFILMGIVVPVAMFLYIRQERKAEKGDPN